MLSERRIRTGIPTGLDPATRRYWGNLGMLALVILTALALLAVPAAGAPAGHSTSPVMTVPPPVPPTVVGTSTLVRTDHGVSATVETSVLTPGDVVTLWWVVFNNPGECENPLPPVSPCGPPDVLNPETQA
jgi:hypothetical protein